MTISTLVKTDREVQQAVQDELEWTPDVDDAGIGVAVENGVVTLSGEVDDYFERTAVNDAAFRTAGVTTVVDDLVIHPLSYAWNVTETDIAKSVKNALQWIAKSPDTVTATIENHTVTLHGEVQWNFEREAARRTIESIKGVVWVVNEITLRSRPSVADTEDNIRRAMLRNATFDADQVRVSVAGTTVTLHGKVRSYSERKQAGIAAWASPHVTQVINDLVITV